MAKRVFTDADAAKMDEAAVKEALRRWRFNPGTEDGKPKVMRHKVKVTFRLEDAH